MIRVRTYDTAPQSVRAPGIQQTALPTVGNVADTSETRTLASLLSSGDKLVKVAAREYVKDEAARVSQSIQQMNADLSAERERYMQENKGQNAIDAGQHFEQYATELAQKYMQDGKFQGRFAEYFEKYAMGNVLHFTEQGRSYGNQQREAWNKSVLDGALSDFQNQVAQNYNNKDWIAYNLQNLEQTVEAMRPGLDNTALMNNVRKAAAQNIVEGYLANDDIAGARQALNENREFLGDKAAAAEISIRNRADALQAKAEAQRNKAGRTILKGYDDAKYKAQFMGDASDLANIASQLRSVGLSDDADAVQSEADMWKEASADVTSAANLPLPEAVSMLDDLSQQTRSTEGMTVEQHKALSTRAKAVKQVVEARIKAFKDDPAAAADNSPNFALPDDATMEDKAAARVTYQVKNGMPTDMTKPLTKDEEEKIATGYAASASPVLFVQQMKQELGTQFAPAMRQLVASKKVPASMNLVADMNPDAGELLAKAGEKDFAKLTESALGMQPTDKTTMKSLIRDELEDVMGTVMAQGTPTSAAQIQESAYLLALQYRTQGMDEKDAAEKAASEVFSSRYTVKGSFRVPMRFDADAVEDGTESVIEELASSADVDMLLPENSGLSSDAIKRRVSSMLKSNGRWIVNNDESGLILTVGGKAVRTKDGKVVSRSFDELEGMGREKQAASWSPMRLFSGG